MGILDEAIREHLELKRQHGADDSELVQLENEAFGPAERPGAAAPDPAAEAPTEFMEQPDLEPEPAAPPAAEEPEELTPRQEAAARVGELQESPHPEAAEEPRTASEPAAGQESLPVEDLEPDIEQTPAAEHQAIPAADPEPQLDEDPEPPAAPDEDPEPVAPAAADPASSGPSTEEREAIAEQPTEMYDIEEELSGAELEIHSTAPQAAPETEADEDEDDDFWDEQRLSDELDQALESPFQALEEDAEEEAEEDEPPVAEAPPEDLRASTNRPTDVLEETPDFLEESPEDADSWFEQRPPKDFDFDD